ncbi:protein of unknown function [Xenorhabdus poinarii G6]|uniref:Uncharacterized protein n=1 Tax=Xenorhabdus poinarii G6 TaxID=1354304 RepID=A0A068QZT4_9GAMM|nr:protein of unknown function [Xenorhabdus poinarii G6]
MAWSPWCNQETRPFFPLKGGKISSSVNSAPNTPKAETIVLHTVMSGVRLPFS